MIKSGELREKLLIERPTRTPIGGGAYETTYTTVLNTFAKIVEERSNPQEIANQENIINYVHFKIRYRPVSPIQIGDRMTWRGFFFIVNNIKVDPLRTSIDLYVNSEMETSDRQPLITT